MPGGGVKGPSVAIWRRARAVCMEDDRAAAETTDGKAHVLLADSTGITAAGKGRRIELKRKVKRDVIKLRMLAEVEPRKMPAFPRRRHERGRCQEPAGRAGRGPEQDGRAAGGPQ